MQLALLVTLAFAAYRITRFVLDDSLIERQRRWFFIRLLVISDDEYDFMRKRHTVPGDASATRKKIAELLMCPYCFGWWSSGVVVWAADLYGSVALPGVMWVAVAGAMMGAWRMIET